MSRNDQARVYWPRPLALSAEEGLFEAALSSVRQELGPWVLQPLGWELFLRLSQKFSSELPGLPGPWEILSLQLRKLAIR